MSTEEMILVNSEELTLSDFVEDGAVKRGLFYDGQRVTTAGCPSPARNSGWWRGKEWVRPIPVTPVRELATIGDVRGKQMDNGIYEDDSDVIDIIEEAKAEWFAMHPECTTPTNEETDQTINKELGLPASGSLRGLAVEFADTTPEFLAANVKSGLNLWFGTVDTNAVEYYNQLGEAERIEYRENTDELSLATKQELDYIDSGVKAPCLS